MQRVVLSVLGTVALALSMMLAAGPAMAQKGGNSVNIRVCNNTGNDAVVAVSYVPVGSSQFLNEGWFAVPARQCRNVVDTDNAYFYGYAEVDGDSSRFWGGDHDLCVIYPGPYEFWSDNSAYCGSGQDLRGFTTLHADNFGTFTWNLNP